MRKVFALSVLAAAALIAIIGVVYGFAIVGDSPVLSAGITELSPEDNKGAALGVQSLLGFGITIVSIALFGFIVDSLGWEAAFFVLGVGALVGPPAMIALRRMPESVKMARGRR